MSSIAKYLMKAVLVVGLLAVSWSMGWESIFPVAGQQGIMSKFKLSNECRLKGE